MFPAENTGPPQRTCFVVFRGSSSSSITGVNEIHQYNLQNYFSVFMQVLVNRMVQQKIAWHFCPATKIQPSCYQEKSF